MPLLLKFFLSILLLFLYEHSWTYRPFLNCRFFFFRFLLISNFLFDLFSVSHESIFYFFSKVVIFHNHMFRFLIGVWARHRLLKIRVNLILLVEIVHSFMSRFRLTRFTINRHSIIGHIFTDWLLPFLIVSFLLFHESTADWLFRLLLTVTVHVSL